MSAVTWLFLVGLALSLALRTWLYGRQVAHVRAHRDRVPPAFRGRVGPAEHRKAADYACERARLGRVETAAEAVLLLALTLGGGLEAMDRLWRGAGLGPIATGVGVVLTVILAASLLELPFAAYRTFRIEARFGFNRTGPAVFAADRVKELVLSGVLGGGLAGSLLWLHAGAGERWWLYAWGLWLGFSLLLAWAFPVLIAPLFNRFSPLAAGEVRARIERLLERTRFPSRGIFVMDGSRRSGHGNAYFAGLGRSRRIVLYDTLLERLDPPEVEAVLAHEIGHHAHRHLRKRLALAALVGAAGFALLGRLASEPWLFTGLGVTTPSAHAALILFALVAPVFGVFLQPLGSWLSRRHELQADAFAARASGAAALTGALVKLYTENAATLTPDPLYSAFHDSHPPPSARIARLESATAS